MPGRGGHHLLRFWHTEVCFSSRDCERAAGLLLQLCESQTRAHLPGAVSPWLRGFSRPLLQGGPATGSSSAQRPCCSPPRPRCTAGRTELGLVPKAAGPAGHREAPWVSPPDTLVLPQPHAAQRGDGGGGRLRQAWETAIPGTRCKSPGRSRCALCGVSRLAPRGAGRSHGHGAGRLRSSATTVRWGRGAAAAPVTVTLTCANSSNLGTGNQDGGTERSHGREG